MEDNQGSILTEPLSIADLIKDGAKFQINTNFEDNLPNELFDDFNFEESDDEDDNKREIIISPWKKSFAELRTQMTKINDNMYKRITEEGLLNSPLVPDRARVIIEYNAYWENEPAPFDSSFMRGQTYIFRCGEMKVLEGLEAAVRTMKKGEEAQFLISYHLLFHEMGCPPRIKPKADGLFIIKLCNFEEVGDEAATDSIPLEDRNKFSVVHSKVKEVHLKGLDYFKHSNIRGACRSFHKAATALEFCRLSNEEEQEQQRKFLIKLYVNLAVCYNRLNLPNKTCSMCNEIRKITDIRQNCKALFQEGRALLLLGEFQRARNILIQAQRLNPDNTEITNELKTLADKYEKYEENGKNIWRKAMGMIQETETDNNKQLSTFKEEIRKSLENFKISPSNQLTLPDGLSSEEVNCIEELAKEFELKVLISDVCNQKSFVILKENKQ